MLMIAPDLDDPSDRIATFMPPQMTPRAALRAKRLAVPRNSVGFAPGWNVSLVPKPDVQAWQESGTPIEIDIRIDGEVAHLRTVWSALDTLLYQAEPQVRIDDLDGELLVALIENHLLAYIESFEALVGAKCSLEKVAKCRDHQNLAHLDLILGVNGSVDPYPAEIYASPSILGLIATAWERSPRRDVAPLSPSFVLTARVATSSVSRAGLRGLAIGDALLFDRVAPDGGIVLCIGEHLTTVGQLTEQGAVTIGAPFAADSPFLLGEFQMSDADFETGSGAAALDEASIDSLPVKLVFELGRREMSIDELRDLGIGGSIPLDKPASSVVDILANGRRVGAGEMVLIGDQLGVRITRLNGHA